MANPFNAEDRAQMETELVRKRMPEIATSGLSHDRNNANKPRS